MGNRAGSYRKNLSGETAYESFIPTMLRSARLVEMDETLWQRLKNARVDLATLEAFSDSIPDVDMFVAMYVRKEALMSSQIEGTQATLEDVLDPLAEDNINLEVADVINYISALQHALKSMNQLPLSMRLLKETHGVLLRGVRGQERDPGEVRRSQNWIGRPGSTLQNARYIPPSVEDLPNLLTDLEFYMNEEPDIDPLVSAALIHYQFETIHPFLDGNGRLGRLLITLYLIDQELLSKPSLYISYFLKRNRSEYYDRLSEVRRTGDYEQWVGFFLDAVSEASLDAGRSMKKLRSLREKNQERIFGSAGSGAVMQIFRYIESHPIIDVSRTAEALTMSYPTVNNSVKNLERLGILKQTAGGRRNRVFAYQEYLDILKEGT